MLQLVDIKKEYATGDNKVEALRGINLNFRKNEFVSILGPSGCGKTTLLNIIGGLDKYTSGDLIINGKSTKDFKDRDWDTYRNHSIGFVFQSYNLIMHQSILNNVELSLTLSGISREERKKRATEALEKVGLKEHINKRPNQLSGGQMQRVAIARAIINNPDIILADEPTGALDTETSVQIMEILKEISKDRLVVMVTHNPDLASTYSTRIINLLDGKITNDSNPFVIKEEKTKQEDPEKKKRHTSMSFWTALHLSLNNLRTKKGRTVMTALAGSIGIIGVALVLAISNGFTTYINTMQSDTLSGYPVSVTTATIDYDSLSNYSPSGSSSSQETPENELVVYDSVLQQYIQYGHYNNITQEFLQTVEQFEQQDKQKSESERQLNLVQYNYVTPLKILFKDENDKTKLRVQKNSISILSGLSSSTFFEELSDNSFFMAQYDVIYQAPSYNSEDIYGLTLVVDKGNRISRSIMNNLGIKLTSKPDGTYENINFETLCEKTYKVVFNNDYYTIDSSDNVSTLQTASQATLDSLYDTLTTNLKITQIVRPKEDSIFDLVNSGVLFKKEFGALYRENCQNSEISQKQQARKATETGNYTFYDPFKISISEFSGIMPADGFADTNSINAFLNLYFKTTVSIEDVYQLAMQQIGTSAVPQSIFFYAKNFDGKKAVQEMVENYNKTATENNKIIYNDQSQLLTSTLGAIINIISYVLIAFASISLVVSSIMIGVITYTSVIERTKEIGVLRSLGARKKDVSRVFNAETAIIGAFAGFLGVVVSWLLCIPINAILSSLADISGIANLNIVHALALVGISTVLSLIAGLIPSRYASKKDPVTALRTE